MFLKTLNKFIFCDEMFDKKVILISCLFLLFLGISCVSATDNNNLTIENNLDYEIANSQDSLNLTKDYVEKEITIEKSIEIDGKGHKITGDKSPVNIKVKNESGIKLVLKNITFDDLKFESSEENNISLIDCNFIKTENNTFNLVAVESYNPHVSISYGRAISKTVSDLAKSIVGKSTDLEAAKKLALWVDKNIKHETAAGFYQSPDVTLERRLGNCCCHSELFLQMCYAIGLYKTHKLSFVHVGTMIFGHRHFFTLIDNLVVDTDWSGSAWGHASFGNRPVYSIVEYPNLPLQRAY